MLLNVLPILRNVRFNLMEYITLRLDSTNEIEQWYVRHNYFLSYYIGDRFRPIYRSSSGLLLQISP